MCWLSQLLLVSTVQGLYDEVKQLFAQSHHGEDEPILAKVAAALGVSAVAITFANPSDVVKVAPLDAVQAPVVGEVSHSALAMRNNLLHCICSCVQWQHRLSCTAARPLLKVVLQICDLEPGFRIPILRPYPQGWACVKTAGSTKTLVRSK